MKPGWVFLGCGLYLTFLVALVISLLDQGFSKSVWAHTGRRWGKFLLGLVILGIGVQILTWFAQ
jgi:hypothetical protein